MSGARHQSLVVGWRHDDPRLPQLREAMGVICGGRCGNCGGNVYFNPSAADAIRNRDSAVFCETCARSDYDAMVGTLDL